MPAHKPSSKRRRKPKRDAQDVSGEALARRCKNEEMLRKRELVLQRMKDIFDKRKAERAAKRNEIRDERLKLQEMEIRSRSKTMQENIMIQIRKDMKSVLVAGVEKVNALKVVGERVQINGFTMTIGTCKYKLKKNVHMVGWGRETLMLGAAFEKVVGQHLKKGFLMVPRGSVSGMWDTPLWFPALNTRITYLEGGCQGLPDEDSVQATRTMAEYCTKLRKADILVVVLSGGTGELLCCPKGRIKLKEFDQLLARLKSAGATDTETNIVRSKLSAVLGGGLARLAYPAKVITLVMSDVPGGHPHLVAGSPTINNPNRDAAFAILRKYNLADDLPPSITEVLAEKSPPNDPLLDDRQSFKFVDYHVVAGTDDAVRGMTDAAFRLGLVPVVLSSTVVGSVREVSQAYAQLAALMILAAEEKINKLDMYEAMKFNRVLPLGEDKVKEIFPSKEKWGLGLCLLLGGAPTLDFTGDTKTGANQELALYFSLDWYLKVKENPILNDYVVWFLGGNTSGIDGSSPVAGAYGYGNLGPAIFKRYKELTREEAELDLKLRGLLRTDPGGAETRDTVKRHDALLDDLSRVSAILPDRVLKQHNANFMFMNINDGDELLHLGHTYTNVCDLHVIRIVRYQCSCDGSCLGQGADQSPPQTICRDETCVVNRTVQPEVLPSGPRPPKVQCCARPTGPKIKIH